MSVIIRLQNLPISANAANIRRFFSGLSIPEGGVHIVGGNDGDAFIAFSTDEDARKAMLLDRQSINGAAVRLLLSSKTEMQSVIESARNTAIFSGLAPPPQKKTDTMSALDVTATTLPNSFPSYKNGPGKSVVPSDMPSHFQNSNTNIQTHPSDLNIHQQPPRSYDRNGLERDQSYYAPPPQQQPSISSRHNDGREPIPPYSNYPPPNDMRSHNQQYGQCYDDYDYNQTSGRSMPPEKDGHMRNGPRYPPPSSESIKHTPPSSAYPQDFAPRGYPPDQPVPFGNHPRENFRDPRTQTDHDFNMRPWPTDDHMNDNHKRQFPDDSLDYDDYPRKRRPPPVRPSVDASGETEFVIRVILPVGDVGIKSIFEVFRGVHIMPKWGIRIEEDSLQRATGYMYIMVTGKDSFDRALSFDNYQFKNSKIRVVPSTPKEFYNVTDSNFSSRCPPNVMKRLPPPEKCFPPFHLDGCIELAELPDDVSKMDVVRFIGAPGLTPDNVALVNFPSNDKTAPSGPNKLRALITLPSPDDLNIILSAKPRPFRQDLPPVRLTPISKQQLIAYSRQTGRMDYPPRGREGYESASDHSKTHCCAIITGFSHPMNDHEILRLFPSVLIPGDAIHMSPDNMTAYVDFISENNCRRAISDISDENGNVKKMNPAIRIEAVSRYDMDSRLREFKKSDVKSRDSNGQRDRDPRESRYPPEPRFRQTEQSSRSYDKPKYEDIPQYDQPPPHSSPSLDRYPNRRTRQPIENSRPLPPKEDDGPRRPNPNVVTVFITNFPLDFTVDQVAGVMRDYYFIPGSIRIRRNPRGDLGEALVDFKSSYDADRALRGLNGFRIAGRPLMLRVDHRG